MRKAIEDPVEPLLAHAWEEGAKELGVRRHDDVGHRPITDAVEDRVGNLPDGNRAVLSGRGEAVELSRDARVRLAEDDPRVLERVEGGPRDRWNQSSYENDRARQLPRPRAQREHESDYSDDQREDQKL